MTKSQIALLTKCIKSNAGMITVYRHSRDHVVAVLRTYRSDAVAKYLAKRAGMYSVEQVAK